MNICKFLCIYESFIGIFGNLCPFLDIDYTDLTVFRHRLTRPFLGTDTLGTSQHRLTLFEFYTRGQRADDRGQTFKIPTINIGINEIDDG